MSRLASATVLALALALALSLPAAPVLAQSPLTLVG